MNTRKVLLRRITERLNHIENLLSKNLITKEAADRLLRVFIALEMSEYTSAELEGILPHENSDSPLDFDLVQQLYVRYQTK